jgi:hypothetical protein
LILKIEQEREREGSGRDSPSSFFLQFACIAFAMPPQCITSHHIMQIFDGRQLIHDSPIDKIQNLHECQLLGWRVRVWPEQLFVL